MNKKIYALTVAILTFFSTNQASADPTYAVLDANGNVTNIIVCGSACAGGTFAGQTVVPQVAADPVTGANRGGFWQGPGTTTYDANSGTFTMTDNRVISKSETEVLDNESFTSSVIISGGKQISFKYSDTIGSNLLTQSNFIVTYAEKTPATLSVMSSGISESLSFDSIKTKEEIINASVNNNLVLINSRVDTLVKLLGEWVKK
jgi:hypothetical protein